jgi:hypothetical protein
MGLTPNHPSKLALAFVGAIAITSRDSRPKLKGKSKYELE